MPRKKNYFVIEILDPETAGPLNQTGVRLRWTADAAVIGKPGMREHLSKVAKEFMELVVKRAAETTKEVK